MTADLANDKFWVNKCMYHDAEKNYHEKFGKLQRNRHTHLDFCEDKTEEMTNRKIKENKNLQKKNLYHMSGHLDIDALREELIHLEAENSKNNSFNLKNSSQKADCVEIIKKEDSYCGKMSVQKTDKKEKLKESKEKKIKAEKKNKKMNIKENVLGGVGMAELNQDSFPKTSLAGEVAKARQHIKSSLECMDQIANDVGSAGNVRLTTLLEKMYGAIENLTKRVEALEIKCASRQIPDKVAVCPAKPQTPASKPVTKPAKKDDVDDEVDLFGSEEEDEESKKIREQRLAEYAAKKSKKPAVIAKSNIILDIKPWSDETDMKEMEKEVRAIQMDGLVWGASKLVPVAFNIKKLQISCVVEDDKVSVDLLSETLEEIKDYVQSVDIAAFNKV